MLTGVPIADTDLGGAITDTVTILFFDSPVRIAGATPLADDYETRATLPGRHDVPVSNSRCMLSFAVEGIDTKRPIYGGEIEKPRE
ncbi:hypothetical protein WN48_11010 [Eufriesea mexicana]|uniref:Uncharacterized protein n=1 Tax=Eufriesea mexicana TaxID=516756 RepID=A0A310SHU4_9HYME|nr:hypothetical protein WN48_11010 [Eufriesea mexicana]